MMRNFYVGKFYDYHDIEEFIEAIIDFPYKAYELFLNDGGKYIALFVRKGTSVDIERLKEYLKHQRITPMFEEDWNDLKDNYRG